MDKVHRDGLDAAKAIAASARMRLGTRAGDDAGPSAASSVSAVVAAPPVSASASASLPASPGGLRGLLRPLVAAAYRLIKPVARPVMFRFRRSMTENLRNEIFHELQRLDTQAAARAMHQQQATHESIQRLRAELLASLDALNLPQDLGTLKAQGTRLIEAQAGAERRAQAMHETLIPRLDQIEQYGFATARRVAMNCGNGEVLVKTESGFVLCAADDHALLACLLDSGELERGTRLLIQRLLRPGDVFIDVGANIGMHTLAAARAMQGQGRIVAFEPFEPSMKLLRRTMAINGYDGIVDFHRAAVSTSAGVHRLYLGAASGHHSLFPLGADGNSQAPQVEVPLVRLDAVVPANTAVRLIKIDVEGAELDVLDSAAALIRANPELALIVEFGPSHLKRTGQSPRQWFEAFEALGLCHKAIEPFGGKLESLTIDQLTQLESINLLFARRDAKVWTTQ